MNDLTIFNSGLPVIPTDPMELKGFWDKLETGIELAKTALNQPNLEPEKYKEILQHGQEWAEIKLNTELEIQKYLDSVPSGSKVGRPRKTPLPMEHPFETKKSAMAKMGLSKKQYDGIKKLTKEAIDAAIEKARETGDIPTRYLALKIQKNILNPRNNAREEKKKEKPVQTKNPSIYKIHLRLLTNTNEEKVWKLQFANEDEFNENLSALVDSIQKVSPKYKIVEPPFGYPGGKTRLFGKIYKHLENQKHIVSPFLGGGAVELNLIQRGHQVTAYDNDEDLFNLWYQIVNNPLELTEILHRKVALLRETTEIWKIRKTFEEIEKNYDLGIYQLHGETDSGCPVELERAVVYWLKLRLSFSNLMGRGTNPYKFFHFLKSSLVNRLKNYNFENFTLGACKSFEESIPQHPDSFLYMDPPFYGKENLYRTGRNFNHELLAELLHQRTNWALSYNDHEYIRELYQGYKIEEIEIKYRMKLRMGKKAEESKELLIYSY